MESESSLRVHTSPALDRILSQINPYTLFLYDPG
jgi:hypothetical protein